MVNSDQVLEVNVQMDLRAAVEDDVSVSNAACVRARVMFVCPGFYSLLQTAGSNGMFFFPLVSNQTL